MSLGEEITEKVMNKDLEQQISNAIDPRFLLQLVCHLIHVISVSE